MIVFKATNADMTCHMGKGIFQYELGVTARAEKSKCGATGLHACEYILDCLNYYQLGSGNRFFKAEAAGDIAEDGINTRISCTELTLLSELTNRDIAREAMVFMKKHPRRNEWEINRSNIQVAGNAAEISVPDGIAIARGLNPIVKGCESSHIGLIKEDEAGNILNAVLFTVRDPVCPDKWYTLEEMMELMKNYGGKEKNRDEKADNIESATG